MNLYNYVTRGARNGGITVHLHPHRAHKADREKPRETFTAGYRNISRLFYKGACNRDSTIYSTTY